MADGLDFSEEEIRQQLATLGYRNVPPHRLQQLKRDLDDLVRKKKLRSFVSSEELDSSGSRTDVSLPSPPAYTKEKVDPLRLAGPGDGFFLRSDGADQERQVFACCENRDHHRDFDMAPKGLPPSAVPTWQGVGPDQIQSPGGTPPRRHLIKRKVLRRHKGQSFVSNESLQSEDSESDGERSSLDSSFWSEREEEREGVHLKPNPAPEDGPRDPLGDGGPGVGKRGEPAEETSDKSKEEDCESDGAHGDGEEGDGVKIGGRAGDGVESDGADSDGVESDGADIESDGADSDGVESDGVDSDGVESDGADDDGVQSGRADGVQCDGADGVQSDGADGDGVQSDGADSNGVQSDGAASNGVQSDGADGSGVKQGGGDSDVVESNGGNGDGVESDGADIESDGADSEGVESDGADGDGVQSDGADGVQSDRADGDGVQSDGGGGNGVKQGGGDSDVVESNGGNGDGVERGGDGGDGDGVKCNDGDEVEQGGGDGDEVKGDGADSNGVESDGGDGEGVEQGGGDGDGVERDGDGVERDGDGVESDGVKSNGREGDGVESDGGDGDGVERDADGVERDADWVESNGGDGVESDGGDVCSGSPTLSLMTSGYGTYRPDSACREELEGGDDRSMAEFDGESREGWEDGEMERTPAAGDWDGGGREGRSSGRGDPSSVLDKRDLPDLRSEQDGRRRRLISPLEDEFPADGGRGLDGAQMSDHEHQDDSSGNDDIKFIDSKVEEWNGNTGGHRTGAASGLEEGLCRLHVTDTENKEASLQSDGASSDSGLSTTAFESFLGGTVEGRGRQELRPRAKAFIRPPLDHPHTRNLKKNDPVSRYFQYKHNWEVFKVPGERDRRALQLEIREQLAYQPPPPRQRRVLAPNTYVVPTEKKRSALRWEIRNNLALGVLPPKHNYWL